MYIDPALHAGQGTARSARDERQRPPNLVAMNVRAPDRDLVRVPGLRAEAQAEAEPVVAADRGRDVAAADEAAAVGDPVGEADGRADARVVGDVTGRDVHPRADVRDDREGRVPRVERLRRP